MMLLVIHWAKLDWAQIIATCGAILVAIITMITQLIAKHSMDSAKELVKTVQQSVNIFDSHFKASDAHVKKLIGYLGDQLKQNQP